MNTVGIIGGIGPESTIEYCRMGVGPQEHLDIIDKTFKKCVKKGLKRAFLEPKTHF